VALAARARQAETTGACDGAETACNGAEAAPPSGAQEEGEEEEEEEEPLSKPAAPPGESGQTSAGPDKAMADLQLQRAHPRQPSLSAVLSAISLLVLGFCYVLL